MHTMVTLGTRFDIDIPVNHFRPDLTLVHWDTHNSLALTNVCFIKEKKNMFCTYPQKHFQESQLHIY